MPKVKELAVNSAGPPYICAELQRAAGDAGCGRSLEPEAAGPANKELPNRAYKELLELDGAFPGVLGSSTGRFTLQRAPGMLLRSPEALWHRCELTKSLAQT